MLLSIVIVNYNSKQLLRRCIEAIHVHRPKIPFEILVIDNRSTDGSCAFLEGDSYSSVRLVVNPASMGYTYAANRGFELAKGDIILFLNPDIKVLEHSIDNMVSHLLEDPTLGAVAGYYVFPDGRFHKYYNRCPTIWAYYVTVFFPTGLASHFNSYRQYHMLDTDFSKPVEVPQPAGGCLLVRKELFDTGYINPVFCMFFSDVDVCRKIYLAGKRIMVFPDCKVLHCHDYASRSEGGKGYLYAIDLFVGCANYFRIYSGLKAFLAVKILFGTMLLLRALLFLGKYLLGKSSRKKVQEKFRILYCFLLNRNILLEYL